MEGWYLWSICHKRTWCRIPRKEYILEMSQTIGLTHWSLGNLDAILKRQFFSLSLLIGIFISLDDNALWWMLWELTDDESTVDQVMAWCHQASSHYLSQCWPRSVSPYGVTRPQRVKYNCDEVWASLYHDISYSHYNDVTTSTMAFHGKCFIWWHHHAISIIEIQWDQ